MLLVKPAGSFGQRLSRMRRERSLSLADLGEMVGVTAACVCKWEKDVSFPHRTSLVKLAASLDTSVDYLANGQREISTDRRQVTELSATVTEAISSAKADVASALKISKNRVHIVIDETT